MLIRLFSITTARGGCFQVVGGVLLYMGHCFLFYSDNLLSGSWTEHPKSPVIVNDPGFKSLSWGADRLFSIRVVL